MWVVFFLRQKGNTIKLMDSGQTDQEKNRHKWPISETKDTVPQHYRPHWH